jgi:hypothetical protein
VRCKFVDTVLFMKFQFVTQTKRVASGQAIDEQAPRGEDKERGKRRGRWSSSSSNLAAGGKVL